MSAERVAPFIQNACPDHSVRGGRAHVRARHTAMRVLERHPEVAGDSFYTAIVCGNLAEVDRVLAERPEAVNAKGGPKDWEPLLYLCFTRLPVPAANDNALAMARALLDRGADPRVYFMAGDSRYTPLVGVIGEGEENRPAHPHRDELTQLLLERGAEPYDIQVIYNTGFKGDILWLLPLLYAQSVKLGRRADWEDPEWHMLDMGGYGSGARWMLNVAVSNNNLSLAEWILSHGATADPPPARDKRMSKLAPHAEAIRAGFTEMADMLVRHGAAPTRLPADGVEAFNAAVLRLDRPEAERLAAKHPMYLRTTPAMFVACDRDRVDIVRFLLDLGISPDVEDRENQRPLHMAAYANALRVAELLIERGAAIDPVESSWSNTPLSAAAYSWHPEMIDLLSRFSRDVFELTYAGKVERLREVLGTEPELAKSRQNGHTLLWWLPPDDEARAMEIARLLLTHGTDPSHKDKEGKRASEYLRTLAMDEVADLLDGDTG